MKLLYLKNYRKGPATNSSSTHSVIFKNKDDMFNDMNVFEENFYDRSTETIAVSKSAKLKYIAANIMYNKSLYDIMCFIYPEMNQYRDLIKNVMTNPDRNHIYDFGMYTRGDLYFKDNLEASIDYLRNIIENDDIIIVGGSDEEEFFYETTENHKEIEKPNYLSKFFGAVKNGNYWVGYKFGRKLRFSTNKDICIPEYPELIDLNITDMCEHNCPFCYKDSNKNGKHADLQDIKDLLSNINRRYNCGDDFKFKKIEFAIGGGNVLLYPYLNELFEYLANAGHIINVTINANDYHRLFDDDKIKNLFEQYVNAVGVSVSTVQQANEIIEYGYWRPKRYKDEQYNCMPSTTVIHLIPEMLGVYRTKEIIEILKNKEYKTRDGIIISFTGENSFTNFLFLGYKTNGRGETQSHTIFNNKELSELFNNTYCVNIDTCFANRYINWLNGHYETINKTLTLIEGEYSMYVDAVNLKAYKSSYQLDKPYNLATKYMVNTDNPNGKKPCETILSAFSWIRRDNNLPIYSKW